MPRLSDEEIQEHLTKVPKWNRDGNAITRTETFRNFREAMDFVDEVADLAEEANHHPDIAINFNKVTLTLTTHDEGGLAARDFRLAAQIDEIH